MLLAVDVGNTNTVLGVFDGDHLVDHWRLETTEGRTADEYMVMLRSLLGFSGIGAEALRAGIICCVVPAVLEPLERMMEVRLGWRPLVVGPGIRTGMPVLTENPREVGADRIVNAVAAFERHHRSAIVVDFGTATTFDCVSERGEYLGGAIAPGLAISADALYHHAAKLPRVEVSRPRSVIGKNTVASIQAGLFFGYVGLVDGIVRRLIAELGGHPLVIATGGLAPIIASESETIEEADPLLTLHGLLLLYGRNTSPL
ncbi:MAG: type III pantothenate kinase [Myxococcota bacterium]|mgnify:CR=1 FL=1